MARLDLLSPRFALPQSEAHAAIRRMVRVFFAPAKWEEAERQVVERFARKERYGAVEGETGTTYDERPARIAWKPFEIAPEVLGVDIFSHQFGHHLVDVIAMERSVGRKVQPLPQGFRLERPLSVAAFESLLSNVLGCAVDLAGHLCWASRTGLLLELLGRQSGSQALPYHQWLRSLSPTTQAQLKAAHDFVWFKRRARDLVTQMASGREGLAACLIGLLREGSGLSAAQAADLTAQMLDRFPPNLDWEVGLYAPLRIPIETDWLEVNCTYPLGVREMSPYVPEGVPLGPVELILQPDTSRPLLSGIYDRQCLILDAVDEIRKGFGLPPDARYEHYRTQAMRD